MKERYLATNSSGQPVIRTDSLREARDCAKIMNGRVLAKALKKENDTE